MGTCFVFSPPLEGYFMNTVADLYIQRKVELHKRRAKTSFACEYVGKTINFFSFQNTFTLLLPSKPIHSQSRDFNH
eukprot:JP438156.1.p1 GENE.JP438156.1~~JP438156.1.p1  ORF type:complete len:76 (+),score=4.78 JP438156.1:207-434(+)